MERISGMSFDFYMMGFPIHVESVNLSISDNSAVALTRGIPDGWVSGDVLNIDPKGGAKSTKKLKYFVTSPDFVRINGVPYLSDEDTRDLIG